MNVARGTLGTTYLESTVVEPLSRQIDRWRGRREMAARGRWDYALAGRIISPARRLRLRSGSTGNRRSHLANWASKRPAAMLAQ